MRSNADFGTWSGPNVDLLLSLLDNWSDRHDGMCRESRISRGYGTLHLLPLHCRDGSVGSVRLASCRRFPPLFPPIDPPLAAFLVTFCQKDSWGNEEIAREP